MRPKFAAVLVLAALVSVLGSAQTAQADTTTVIATEDTFTAQSNPDTTQGSSGSLLVNAPPRERRAYVKFTVTGIPDGSTEVRAVLRLWASTSASASFTAQAVSSSWSESTLTWTPSRRWARPSHR